jgi:rod shape-determining protein MreB
MMGFLKHFRILSNDLAIDLGTANTVIWKNGEIVLNEPSIVAYDKTTDRITQIGNDAQAMIGKVHRDIEIMYPMKDGVIADPRVAEGMLRAYIGNIGGNWARKIIVCVPSGVTEADKRIVRDTCEHAGAKEVHLIAEPMAGAIGIEFNGERLDVLEPKGNMIIDIGGGTTEIAVISAAGIVCEQSIKIAGNALTEAILRYLRNEYKLIIGERTATNFKHNAGSAYPLSKELEFEVTGRDLVGGLPTSKSVSTVEIREQALAVPITTIINSILNLLSQVPPELAKDIYERGIWLTGGGALLKGLGQRIAEETGLQVHIPEEPLLAVARGTGYVLDNLSKYRSVLLKHSAHL